MRLAVTADLHISNNLYLARIAEKGWTDRLLDSAQCFQDIVRAEADAVVVLGDMFNNRLLDAPTMSVLVPILRRNKKPLYILPGNHDAHDATGIHYNVKYLSEYPHVDILGEGSVGKWGGAKVMALPYLPERLAQKKIKELKGDILLCHQSIAGCRQGGWISQYGLNAMDYDHFNYVLAGHFHEAQEFHNGRYVGSPMALNFQETGAKGYWLVDIENGDVTRMELVEVDAPMFKTLSFSGELNITDVILKIKKAGHIHGTYFHLKFKLKPEDVLKLKSHQNDIVDELPLLTRSVIWTISTDEVQKTVRGVMQSTALPTIDSMLDKYVEESPTLAESDKKDVLDIGTEIYNEARS